jgi:carbon-monoxide dehydrogenase medium subunit
MQVPAPFTYERASSVDHALTLLEQGGEDARLVAGGHSLLPMMKLRIANLEKLIDINDLHNELGYIKVDGDVCKIGAMTRHRELLDSVELGKLFPIITDAEKVIADPIVRNRGTIGGSLCQADPAEDLTAACRALDASVVIRSKSGERVVHVDDFEQGPYETACAQTEIVTEVRIPIKKGGSSAYHKVERRAGDWACAAAGAAIWMDKGKIVDARVGLSAVNQDTEALRAIGELLRGQSPSEELWARAGEIAAAGCDPSKDNRGSVAYKRHLANELTKRSLRVAAARVQG